MIKIISPKNNISEFTTSLVEIDGDFSPIREIIRKNDYSNYSFEVEGEVIPANETYQLQLNIKEVGIFHFIFKSKDFKKDDVMKEVSGLKDLVVDNAESAKYKIAALINIIKNYNPLFGVYKESPDTYYYSDELEPLLHNLFTIFVVRAEQNHPLYEFSIGEERSEELVNNPDKKQKITKYSKERLIRELLRNKFTLLLVLVSTILIEVSIPLGVLNVYSKNVLYIFLFVCGMIGIVMNAYCYVDYFRNRNIKNPLFIFSISANALGIGIGIGVFAIFYKISTKVEKTPSLGSFILIGVLVALIIIAATIAIINFIPKKNRGK